MRLDNAETEKLNRRRTEAKNKFYPFPNHLLDGNWEDYWREVSVHYIPYYSYEEILSVFAEENTSLSILKAAETLTKYLTEGAIERIERDALPSNGEREKVKAIYAGQPVQIDLEAELNQVAENALVRLSPDDVLRARLILLRLIRIGQPNDNSGDTCQRVPLDSFPLTESRIIQDLRDSRLLLLETDTSTGKQTVQIAQNEFLRGWERLRRWLTEDRSFLMWLSGLRIALENWQRAKSDVAESGTPIDSNNLLLEGGELVIALNWLKERNADIYPAERAYIEQSRQMREPVITFGSNAKSEKTFAVPQRDSVSMQQAQQILRGQQAEPQEMLELAKRLKAETRFGYARRLLARASKHESIAKNKKLRLNIFQQLALCTYKDQDLPADARLDRSLDILNQVEDFAVTVNQETLGLIGAIYKRKWEVDNQRQNLERSLFYYLRGYREGPANDQGYTGINSAFVLDQLASLEEGEAEEASRSSNIAEQRRSRAKEIRQDIIAQVGVQIGDSEHQWVADKWWYYATLAEAHFGLQNYDVAVRWLEEGKEAAGIIYEWELESCARQLAAIARLQDDQNLKAAEFTFTPAWEALEKAFGSDAVPRTAFLGKIGLAMSGGGFRASLYHLGVLAQLAELDVLRQIEILSCVSGGSIVGAHYYLKVRHLLQTKSEDEIKREDYLKLVREMIDEFVVGVQENIRMSVPLNPLKTFRMLWNSAYSRTTRAGELYEQYIYSRIDDGEQNQERWLNGLTISPLIKNADGTTYKDKDFAPKYQNWRRDAKVPILVINAATLNTGHTWQFTASWMGESPSGIDSEIDGNDRLRRMYYSEAPEEHQRIRLGAAVGASAAVPGIFEPLTLDNLYPERIIRLVDGGVCDNQGVGSLLEQDCRVMLVSDASGQMVSQPAASRSIYGVLLRTYDIFQARIRQAEYHDLKGRHRSGLLLGFMFVHLKGDLEVDPIDWLNCPNPYDASDDARPASRRGPLTRYGISKEIQELLSGIRTDLDSFSDAESYALMTSGYRMTEHQFKQGKCVEGFSAPSQAEDWKFLQIEESMKGGSASYDYLKHLLAAGDSIFFKIWKIDPVLRYSLAMLLLIATVLITAVAYWQWNLPLPGFISQSGAAIADGMARNLANIGETLPIMTLSNFVLAISLIIATFLNSFLVRYLVNRILTPIGGDSLARNIVSAVRWKDTLRRIAAAIILSTIGFVAALVHLYIFDRRFLRLGSINTLKKLKDKGTNFNKTPNP